MRQFLLILLLLPLYGLSQSETQQKEAFRNNKTTTQPQTQQTRTETQQKVQIRTDNTTQNYNSRPTENYNFNPRRPIYPYTFNRWDRLNRWNRWGAPIDYSFYNDFYISNRWGYRMPARIYYTKNGKQDTVVSKKSKVRLGLNLSTKNEIGGWFTVGRDVYFKASVNKTFTPDESTFYSNITMDVVQRWVTSNPSQNYKLDDLTEGWNVYFGVGKEFKDFGANVSLGLGKETNNFQYFDGTYILSNNGKYSFRNFVENYTTFSVGLTKDIKSLSLSLDFDPIRKDIYFGLGFNF